VVRVSASVWIETLEFFHGPDQGDILPFFLHNIAEQAMRKRTHKDMKSNDIEYNKIIIER
jgi:hypothetical protein